MDVDKFIAIIFFVAAIGIVIRVAWVLYFYFVRIKAWRKVEGEILDSGSEYFVSDTDVDTAGWRYKVLYKYKILEIEYFSKNIGKNIGILSPVEESIDRYDGKYKKGNRVTVYYNPNNPGDSVIDSEFDSKTLLPLFISVIGIIVGIYLWGSAK